MCISNFGNPRHNTSAAARQPFQHNDTAAAAASMMISRTRAKDMDLSALLEPKPLASDHDQHQQHQQHHQHSIVVQHNYHDHSHDSRSCYQEEHPARGGVTTPFPLKLHEMLETAQADGHEHIVSWQPHGRCLVVHKPKEFVELLPHYFKLSKIASFQRQLNLYGFQRLTRGRDRGGYYHELFLRGSMFLAHNIHRIKVKGTGVRARSNPEQEPNFWEMPWVSDDNNKNNSCSESSPQQQQHQQQMVKLANTVVQSISSMGQLPPALQPEDHHPAVARLHYDPFLQNELDLVSSFGKSFHYLDPYKPMSAMEQPKWSVSDAELLQNEAETFFEDFDFPEHIGAEIEDDVVFGDMLESLIS
jgi:hypothetical protein